MPSKRRRIPGEDPDKRPGVTGEVQQDVTLEQSQTDPVLTARIEHSGNSIGVCLVDTSKGEVQIQSINFETDLTGKESLKGRAAFVAQARGLVNRMRVLVGGKGNDATEKIINTLTYITNVSKEEGQIKIRPVSLHPSFERVFKKMDREIEREEALVGYLSEMIYESTLNRFKDQDAGKTRLGGSQTEESDGAYQLPTEVELYTMELPQGWGEATVAEFRQSFDDVNQYEIQVKLGDADPNLPSARITAPATSTLGASRAGVGRDLKDAAVILFAEGEPPVGVKEIDVDLGLDDSPQATDGEGLGPPVVLDSSALVPLEDDGVNSTARVVTPFDVPEPGPGVFRRSTSNAEEGTTIEIIDED